MKFCPKCRTEVADETAFCSECGKNLDGNASFMNLPVKFWMILIGTSGVAVFSLFSWIKIPIILDYAVKFNLFNIWGKLKDSGFDSFLDESPEFYDIKIFLVILTIIMSLSFSLLIISLVKYKSEKCDILAYCGFTFSALASLIFIIRVLVFTKDMDITGLTVFPFLTFVFSVISFIFLLNTRRFMNSKL